MRRGKLFWIAAGVAVCSPVLAYDLARLSLVEDPLILGVQGNSAPTACAISDDGDVIGFLSDATNLIAGDLNGLADAFVERGHAESSDGQRFEALRDRCAAVAVGVGFYNGDDLTGGFKAAAHLVEVVSQRAEFDGRDGGRMVLGR